MFRIWAHDYVNLGQQIQDTRNTLFSTHGLDLGAEGRETLKQRLGWMLSVCEKKNLQFPKGCSKDK
jgi:hypothetical protein